jgi:hypothetical protein
MTINSAKHPPSIKQPCNLQEAADLAGGAVALVRSWRDEWPEPCLEDGLIQPESAETLTDDINIEFLPSSKELQTLRCQAKLEFQGKPFQIGWMKTMPPR